MENDIGIHEKETINRSLRINHNATIVGILLPVIVKIQRRTFYIIYRVPVTNFTVYRPKVIRLIF